MHLLKKILLFCVALVSLHFLCQTQTDGFSRIRIESELPFEADWNGPAVPDQPFHYLGCGAQTFAFVSEDGQYVIKFYRHHRCRHPLSLFAPLFPRLRQTLAKRSLKRQKDFASYRIAFDRLKEETGLISIHLARTDTINQKLTVYDKLGIVHQIDLDNMSFLLQKKASPFYATLQQWIDSGCKEQAKQGLSELVSLLRSQFQKGIFDKDPNLKTNFGFLDGHPVQFDVGRFRDQPEMIGPNEIGRATDSLVRWLNQKAPDLAAYLEKVRND